MINKAFNFAGLTNEEVLNSRLEYGSNKYELKSKNTFLKTLILVIREPMVLLLLLTSIIYFIGGNYGDGWFLTAAIILVSAISIFQDSRSRIALDKLKSFTSPHCKVIRDGNTVMIEREELVVGDYLIVEEGSTIAADGIIIQANDFSVNESILTGESMTVQKDQSQKDNKVYQGTMVTTGLAIVQISAIALNTELAKLGKSLDSIDEESSPLEIQIGNFVRKMVFAGSIVFVGVWIFNYAKSSDLLDSLLKALTLAMSILPEEIPVAFTTFMALGAWRLMKMGVIVKKMKTVETLGSATVICADKTGTITENRMTLARIYSLNEDKLKEPGNDRSQDDIKLITLAMWASEPIPFDPMEVALHDAYENLNVPDERQEYSLVHEYPLDGIPPMMTHIFENSEGNKIIAAKGAPEAIIEVSHITQIEKKRIEEVLKSLASQGFRVLGVAQSLQYDKSYPEKQQELSFEFSGLVAFYDPPKVNIKHVFEQFYKAGLAVKIITGDNTETTMAIAKQIGLKNHTTHYTGEQVMAMSVEQLGKAVSDTNMFTRMFPLAKLKVIEALKDRGEIVAMTGDGVNDGPALKASHIGIAMGKKGTEIAKEAAALILVNDDLSQMIDAVAMGRKIYTNLKKAIQYIISIHIPIILTVFLPLVLGWIYPNIFTPVHIIFLELIMGPTCSIIYENEPMEKNILNQKPRTYSTTFFNSRELSTSIIQGLFITVGTLSTYIYAVNNGGSEELTRSMVFTTLISANIVLTLVNRSFYYSIFSTLAYKNYMVPLIIGITIIMTGLLLYIPTLADFFQFSPPSVSLISVSIVIGFLSVIWYEVVKWYNRSRSTKIILTK